MKIITTILTLILLLLFDNVIAQEINYKDVKKQVVSSIENNIQSVGKLLESGILKEPNITNFRVLSIDSPQEDFLTDVISETANSYLISAIIDLNYRHSINEELSLIIKFQLEKVFNSYQVNYIQLTGLKSKEKHQCLESSKFFILKKPESFCPSVSTTKF